MTETSSWELTQRTRLPGCGWKRHRTWSAEVILERPHASNLDAGTTGTMSRRFSYNTLWRSNMACWKIPCLADFPISRWPFTVDFQTSYVRLPEGISTGDMWDHLGGHNAWPTLFSKCHHPISGHVHPMELKNGRIESLECHVPEFRTPLNCGSETKNRCINVTMGQFFEDRDDLGILQTTRSSVSSLRVCITLGEHKNVVWNQR